MIQKITADFRLSQISISGHIPCEAPVNGPPVKMTDQSDAHCLDAFVRGRDEGAFTQLAHRFAPLVYAAARRQSAHPDAAADIAQAVFIVLFRKAAKIDPRNLPGWLVRTTYLVARQARREEQRRKRREKIAASMVQQMTRPTSNHDSDWQHIAPLLDEALSRLSQNDRNVVSMRYLQQRSIAEIAATLAITESTARKRLERALLRIRRDFARRGVEVGPWAIGSSIASHAVPPLPPGIAETIAHGAFAASHGAASATTAAILAKGVIVMGATKKAALAAVALLLLLSVGGVATVVRLYFWNNEEAPAAAPLATTSAMPVPALPAAAAPPDQINVGIYLSDYTANGPHWIPNNYGYTDQIRPVRSLHDPSIQLFPVVEPGTENQPQLARLIRNSFPGKKSLNSASLEDLQTLDVLVAQAAHNVPMGTQTAIHEAVKEGLGFLNRGFMTVQPGYIPLYADLSGMHPVNYGFNMAPVECEIVGDSPLLGDLAGHIGKTMMIEPAGPLGRLAGIPLIRISDMHQITTQPPRRVTLGTYMYPLCLSQFGKGRVINFSFAHYEVPQVLEQASHGRFYIHCVQWLAGKPLS